METTSPKINKNEDTKAVAKSPPVEVTRNFDVPIERVWQAWANPELVKQWWGPEGYSCPEAKSDFRQGGKYLFAMKGPDAKVAWSGGVYEQIVENKKIVYTDNFTDKDGKVVDPEVYGMPGEWGDTTRVTVEFEKISDAETKMSLKHEGIPADMHDDCVQGWTSSIGKIEKLVRRA